MAKQHLIANKGRYAHAGCDRRVKGPLVETVGEVTCSRCLTLLQRMYGGPRVALEKARQAIIDPGGDGKAKVSHGWSGGPMKCVRCHLPTVEQRKGIVVEGPRCACP